MQKIVAKALMLSNYNHVSTADLDLHLQSHPDYPHLKAITDTLDYFGVENLAADVPKEYFDKLPNFFLALLNADYTEGYVLATKKNDKVILDFADNSREVLSRDSFEAKWSGTVVALEQAKKKSFQINASQFALPLIICLVGISLFYPAFNLLTTIFTLLSGLGIFIGYLIVKEELGIHSRAVATVCTAMGATNCAATIKSEKSKLLNFFSMSDATIAFFVSTFILNVFVKPDPTSYLLILLVTIPFLVYSVFLQGIILKQWCILCLGVSLLVLLQIALLFFYSHETILINFPVLVSAGLVFLLIFFGWFSIKPLIISHLQLPVTQKEFLKFKRNEKVFQNLLQQKDVNLSDEIQDKLISFGAQDSKKVVTSITNPFCGFCVDHYKGYRKLIKSHGDKVRFNVLFNVPTTDKENNAYKICIKLIELYHSGKRDLALVALDDWFANRDIAAWKNQYGFTETDTEKYDAILEANYKWCVSNKIFYTPATVLGHHVYPNEYDNSDLPFFLDQL